MRKAKDRFFDYNKLYYFVSWRDLVKLFSQMCLSVWEWWESMDVIAGDGGRLCNAFLMLQKLLDGLRAREDRVESFS